MQGKASANDFKNHFGCIYGREHKSVNRLTFRQLASKEERKEE